MEERLVMSSHFSVGAEVRAILNSSIGGAPVRPNTPVLPLESPAATASFIDPTVRVFQGNRTRIGRRDFIAPGATLDATGGFIKIRSTSTIQDNATLRTAPGRTLGTGGIFIGDNVVIGTGATVIGPAAIGGASRANVPNAAATSIGANAVIDGAVVEPGAFVGALARVGPGVIVPTGFRVLPGMNVTTNAEASDPSLGMVVRVTSADTSAATARSIISANTLLAAGYTNLYQGSNATGGASSAGPVPSAIAAAGSTVFFGALNTVTGASSEPTSRLVNFEPAAGTPQFLAADGSLVNLDPNRSYRFPARVIGAVRFGQQGVGSGLAFGKFDSIRADEAPSITFAGPINRIGDHVSIHSPLGRVQTATTTTVVNTTTVTSTGATTTTTTATTVNTPGPAAATPAAGTTTATTTGTNAAGLATTGTVSTTIATRTTNLGSIAIGSRFNALDRAVILGGPSGTTSLGDDVTVGSGAVVDTSVIGNGVFIGSRAYIQNSTIPAGAVVPDGAIIINNAIVGTVRS